MKKILVLLLVFALSVSVLAGCSSNNADQPEQPEQPEQPAEKVEITIAIATAPNTIEAQAAEMFKDLVEERSNGKFEVSIFAGGSLGGERDNIEQLKINEVQMSILGDILPSLLAPDSSPTVVPFIYPDLEAVYAAWDGKLGDMMKASIEENGLVMLGLQERGARNLTTNKPVNSPEDLKGLKIRVPEIPSWVKVWSQLGTLPTPIAWPEVYNSLQLGVVEAQENPYSNITTAKLYEVQDYLVHTNHLINVFHWAGSKQFFDSLSEEDRNLIQTAIDEATAWADQETKATADQLLQEIKDTGMQVIEVDGAAFRRAALPAIQELAKDWAPGVYEEVEQYLK